MPAEIHYLRKTSRAPSFSLRADGELRKAGASSNEVREVGATYEHRSKDWRFARDQRKAGIEHLEWEDRLSPMRPWAFWLAVIGSWALFAGAIWGMAALFADI